MPHIPKAVCSKCMKEMVPHINGYTLEAVLDDGRSYYKVGADEWICNSCGTKVFIGFANRAIENFDERYPNIRVDGKFTFNG